MNRGTGRRGLAIAWAVVGGVLLLAAIITLVVVLLTPPSTGAPSPGTGTPPEREPTPTATVPSNGTAVVDETAAERGLVPEPITRDVETYATAALEAAGTFDTSSLSRDEFVTYLGTWISGDPGYEAGEDRDYNRDAARAAVGESVVIPATEWESLQRAFGTSSAEILGDLEIEDAQRHYDGAGEMRNVYADVVVTYTHKAGADGSEGESSFEDRVRVGVQILCGADTEPTPETAQTAGDCKILRYLPVIG